MKDVFITTWNVGENWTSHCPFAILYFYVEKKCQKLFILHHCISIILLVIFNYQSTKKRNFYSIKLENPIRMKSFWYIMINNLCEYINFTSGSIEEDIWKQNRTAHIWNYTAFYFHEITLHFDMFLPHPRNRNYEYLKKLFFFFGCCNN